MSEYQPTPNSRAADRTTPEPASEPAGLPDVVVDPKGDPTVIKDAPQLLKALNQQKGTVVLHQVLDDLGRGFEDYTQDELFITSWGHAVDFSGIRMQLDERTPLLAHPTNGAKIPAATEAVINAKRTLPLQTTLMPGNPDEMERLRNRLLLVRAYKKTMAWGLAMAEAEESQIENQLNDQLRANFDPIESALKVKSAVNSRLKDILFALEDYFKGSAMQGVETRKKIEEALARERDKHQAGPGHGTPGTTGGPQPSPGPQPPPGTPGTGGGPPAPPPPDPGHKPRGRGKKKA